MASAELVQRSRPEFLPSIGLTRLDCPFDDLNCGSLTGLGNLVVGFGTTISGVLSSVSGGSVNTAAGSF
jgi:hypothetical protein